MQDYSRLKQSLLDLLKRENVITGTERITLMVTTGNCKTHALEQMRVLEAEGHVTIIRSRGGRGIRTVYKRNHNSPGQPRRKR